MKTISLAVLVILSFFICSISAQVADYSTIGNTKVSKTILVYDGNENPALSVIFQGQHKNLKANWQDFLKDHYSVKLKRTGSILMSPDGNFVDVTAKPVTLYSIIEEKSPQAGITIAMSYSNIDFISDTNYPDEFTKMESLLKRFVKYYQLNMVNEELADIQDTYNDMMKEMEKREKEKSKINDDIVKLEGDIFEAKSDIGKREKKIMELEAEIKELKTEITVTENEITETKRLLENSLSNIQTQKEKLDIQKEKLEKITAKKELIIAE